MLALLLLAPVAILPPEGATPADGEIGLVMQNEATRLVLQTRPAFDAKQALRAAERMGIDQTQMGKPEVAAKVGRALGAREAVWSRLRGRQLEAGRVDKPGPSSKWTLPEALPDAVAAGARALAGLALGAEPPLPAPPSKSAAALQSFASCWASLIRQPIGIENPAVLSAPEIGRAERACQAAVAADPDFQDAWGALGLALALAGKDKEAIQALVRVRYAERTVPAYWLGRYWLVTRYQSPQAGETALREELRRLPNFLLAYGYLAEHLAALGRHDESLDIWQKAIQLAPNSPFFRGRASDQLAHLKRYPEAIDAAKAALALDPDSPEAVLELGGRYLDAGKLDEAITTLEPAAQKTDARGELLVRLGWAYAKRAKQSAVGTDDSARAEALLIRAEKVANRPSEWRTRARALADLARVYDRRGDKIKANDTMRRALDAGLADFMVAQKDPRLTELTRVAEVERKRRPGIEGPRWIPPREASPWPGGQTDPHADPHLQSFPPVPPSFDLIRF
jgi:tetratricopeptide (TPR) repeat protein